VEEVHISVLLYYNEQVVVKNSVQKKSKIIITKKGRFKMSKRKKYTLRIELKGVSGY